MKTKFLYLAVALLAIFSTAHYFRSEASISGPSGPVFVSFPCSNGSAQVNWSIKGPNFCLPTISNANNQASNFAQGAVCNQTNFNSAQLPTNTTALLVAFPWAAKAAGAAGGRFNALSAYTNTTCTNGVGTLPTFQWQINPGFTELAGTYAAGQTIIQDYAVMWVSLCNTNPITICTITVNSGGNGNVDWGIGGTNPPFIVGYTTS